MKRHHSWFVLCLVLLLALSGCATVPKEPAVDPEHFAAAKRFLSSIDAGGIAFEALQRNYEKGDVEEPAIAQIMRNALADVTAEDFENLVAEVYVRHLSRQHLIELAEFTESPSGNRFFRSALGFTRDGQEIPREEFIRQFSADELTYILKAVQGDAFVALNEALPRINQELSVAGKKLGERKLREYLSKQ